MLWIFLALLAHTANGAVFIVDKSLLGGKSTLGKPLTYALYSAALAVLSIVLLPFASVVVTSFIVNWSVLAGIVHILALYVFFVAMRFGEPSRVVPITGSAVPLFTILFAVIFLGEVFTFWQYVGTVLLLIGGGLLAIRHSTFRTPSSSPLKRGRELSHLLFPVLAGALFAAYFVITKHIYTFADAEFLSVFMATRVIEGMMALCAVGVMRLVVVKSKQLNLPSSAPRTKARLTFSPIGEKGTSVLFIFNKALAAGAFLLQTYAISLGSVSVVNALQGVQFAVVFLFSALFTVMLPNLFHEDMRQKVVVQKITGIILLSIGITLIA
ncbi:MAG: EamA family transporter [bacterium]|nr:EamA family transporter [bacterium]